MLINAIKMNTTKETHLIDMSDDDIVPHIRSFGFLFVWRDAMHCELFREY